MSDSNPQQNTPYIEDMDPGEYYWCACKKSADQPFCDGAHKGTEFVPLLHEIKQAGRVVWCGCKQTKTPPFCDGTHNKL
ncbi:MAG: CDGSH iron-sulfur domain-containing protein [Immundisolibacteraceae bacterium]|nr:CDGSH iron-sulfur domain-containing protein [Immundisolibacteraceae bacterium]